VPYYPPEKESKAFFKNTSQEEKMVQEYTGINFLELGEVGVFAFWTYLHDAVIWNCDQTEDGRKYLENAYNYKQTKPDRTGLKELIGMKVVK
jgi:hypothetical protein